MEVDMLFNPMLPFLIYQRWLETVVLPYLDSFESRYAKLEAEDLRATGYEGRHNEPCADEIKHRALAFIEAPRA